MRTLASVLAGTALAAGLLTLTGTAASAEEKIPEKTIKSECQDAGGTYNTTMKKGVRYSMCEYTGIGGGVNNDYYKNGKYTHTD